MNEAKNSICCDLCDAIMPDDIGAAAEAGWSPTYWAGDDEIGRPICGVCSETRCKVENESGELVLKRSGADGVKFDKALELLARACRLLYEIGSPACVDVGERIDAMLGKELKEEGKRLE